jgi:hypothetical protein
MRHRAAAGAVEAAAELVVHQRDVELVDVLVAARDDALDMAGMRLGARDPALLRVFESPRERGVVEIGVYVFEREVQLRRHLCHGLAIR